MSMLKLSAPWMIHYRKINAMFENDKQVNVIFDEDKMEIRLYVEDAAKANALDMLLRDEISFGDTVLKVTVIPANKGVLTLGAENDGFSSELYNSAFYMNPAFSYVKTVPPSMGFGACYVVFAKKVVQYFNDSLSDVNGFCSTLYQEIAKDIFADVPGVFYCTDTAERCEYLPF